ncbi:hypothetical protein B9Z55_019713 [Caenorhabditis nigoni]|uniref:CCHC-type domain-containing protein n=1 Tax=Caenorhabditis nigoni TaxID=1611254 RepID=A0A2G5TJJ8_9PELO|nr:hypothetical protein B9Z55_019713 [Caenorhabditis nigoni]
MERKKEYTEYDLLDAPSDLEANVKAEKIRAIEPDSDSGSHNSSEDASMLAKRVQKALSNHRGDQVTEQLVRKIYQKGGLDAYHQTMEYIEAQRIPTNAEISLLKTYILHGSKREDQMMMEHRQQLLCLHEKIKEMDQEMAKLRLDNKKMKNAMKTGRMQRTQEPIFEQDRAEGCKVCQATDHPASRCKIYPNAEAKRAFLKSKGACFICCGTGHKEDECPARDVTPKCEECDAKHFRSLCLHRYGAAVLEKKKKEEEKKAEEKRMKLGATMLAGLKVLAQPKLTTNQKRKLRKKAAEAVKKAGGK